MNETIRDDILDYKGIFYDSKKNTYTIDFFKTIEGKRVHIFGSNYPSENIALEYKRILLERKTQELAHHSSKQMSFAEFFEKFIEYRSHHVRYSSLSQANTVYHKYFMRHKDAPASTLLGHFEMNDVYQDVIYDNELSPSWKNRIIGILRGFTTCAFKWKIIDSETHQDLMSLLENVPEGKRKVERPIWTTHEEARFLSVIDNPTHKVMFTLFLELGARLGEFLGITWDVYDGKRGTIAICKQLLHGSQKHYELSEILKTKESYRVCKLKKETKEMLNDYKKVQPPSPYMFCSSLNPSQPFSKAAFRKYFNLYMEESGVKRITPHCVRHGRATKMLKVCKNMLEVKAVAKYMGHSPMILLNVYSHSDDSIIDKVLKRLG